MFIEFLDDLLHKFPPPPLNVVYFEQRLYTEKDEKARKLVQNLAKNVFFQVSTRTLVEDFIPRKKQLFSFLFQPFCTKNIEKAYFDQHLECAAPKPLSEYTIPKC